MSNAEVVLLEVSNEVATITLNRPEQRNALNLLMAEQLHAAIERAGSDPDVRVVLIRGAGPVFCAGADLKERVGVTPAWLRKRRLTAFAAYEAIEACPKPCIAVAHGAVVGSGCDIAAACDFTIASTRATFRYPEAVWGTVGATQRLPRIVGKRLAKELIFTGRVVDAAEALRIGLVNRLVAPDQLDDTVTSIVEMILKAFPLSVQLAKRCIDVGSVSDFHTGMEYEILAIDRCLADGEWKRGIEVFGQRQRSGN